MKQETKEKIAGYAIITLIAVAMFCLGYVFGINDETREAQEIVDEFQRTHECRYLENDLGIYNPDLIIDVNAS